MEQPTAARGSIILLAVLAITSALGYGLNIVLAWLLPADDYGTYGIAIAILGILSIFITYGFPWTVVKFLAEYGDKGTSYPIFKSALLGNFLIALVISALFYLVYSFFLFSTNIPDAVIFIIMAIILVFSLRAIYLRTLHGRMRFQEFGTVSIIEAVLRVAVGLGLVLLGYNVAGALAGQLLAGLVALIIAAYLLREFKFWSGKGWANIKVFTFAWRMFLGMLGITMLNQVDILGVRFFSQGTVTAQLVGYYQAVRILAFIPLYLAGGFMGGVFPFISRYAEEGSRNYFLLTLRYIVLIAIPFFAILVAIPGSFIELVFPPAYVAGADAIRILAVGGVLVAIIYVLVQVLQALGYPGLPAKVLMIAALLQIGLLAVLVPNFGLVGAAAATSIACLFGAIWLTVKIAVLYQLKPQLGQIVKLLLTLAITGLSLFLIPHSGRILTVLDVVLVSMIYLFLLVVLRLLRVSDIDILRSALPQNSLILAPVRVLKKLIVRLGGS